MIRLVLVLALGGMAENCLGADTVSVPIKRYVPFGVISRAYSQNGTQRADACSDSVVRVYDVSTNQLQKEIAVKSARPGIFTSNWYGEEDTAKVFLAGDSAIFEVSIKSGTARLLPLPRMWIPIELSLSKDGKKAIIKDHDMDSSTLWDLEAGTHKRCFLGLKKKPERVTFTPDGKRILLLWHADTVGQLRDAATDSVLVDYGFPGGINPTPSFSPDGKTFIIPFRKNQNLYAQCIVSMDVNTGETLEIDSSRANSRTLRGIDFLAYSPDGKNILINDVFTFEVLTAHSSLTLASWKTMWDSGYSNGPAMWFSSDNNSILAPFQQRRTKTYGLRQLQTLPWKETLRERKQDLPDVRFSGFNKKGEVLFIGRYRYQYMHPNFGLTEWDSVIFWNGVTKKRFRAAYASGVPQGAADVYEDFRFYPGENLLLAVSWYASSYQRTKSRSDIYSINDTGCALIGRGSLSHDHQYAIDFQSGYYDLFDLQKRDSAKIPFDFPAGWRITDVKSQELICMARIDPRNQFDDALVYLAIWNLKTQTKIAEFQPAGFGWFDKRDGGDEFNAEFTDDDAHLIISHGGLTPQLIDAATGSHKATYPTMNGMSNFTVTPDKKHVMVGNACYGILTGELERRYPNLAGQVTFNPLNPRQFLAGSDLWELPYAISGIIKKAVGPAKSVLRLRINNGMAHIDGLRAYGSGIEKATLVFNDLNGKNVARVDFPIKGASQSIKLPALAHGAYLCRIVNASHAVLAQGEYLYYTP